MLFARAIAGHKAQLPMRRAATMRLLSRDLDRSAAAARLRAVGEYGRGAAMAIKLGGDDDELAETHEINVTPFIDVMLVLLIIFMVAAPLATVDVRVELPAVHRAAAAAAGQAGLPDDQVRPRPGRSAIRRLPATRSARRCRPPPAGTTSSACSCAPTRAWPMAR